MLRRPVLLAGLLAVVLLPTSASATMPALSDGGGLSAGSAPTGITAGPDDGLYVTERDRNAVARFTTEGALAQEWALPSDGGAGCPAGITTGPDGRL